MRVSWLLFVSSTLLQCTSALEPWYFTWTDPSGKTHPETNTKPDICQKIDNPIGKHFDWTASDGWCIYMWENTNCTGDNAGYTCKSWPWRRDAGSHVRSFKASVNNTDTSDTANANDSNDSKNSNTDNAADNNSSDSLSGGAIAGIVIGVVAGVAILATVAWFFLFHLRRQKKASTLEPFMESGPSEPGDDTVEADTVPQTQQTQNLAFTTLSEMSDTQKEKPGELNDNHIVEMPDSHRTAELDATETVWHKK